MKKYDLISSFVFLIFGGFVIFSSLRMPVGNFSEPRAGLFPLITGIVMCLIAAGMFITKILRSGSSEDEPLGDDKKLWHNKSAATIGMMFLYAITIDWLGFLTVTLIMLFVLYKAIGNMSLKASIGGAVLSSAVAYLLFKVWLNVQLPVGPLGV